MRILLQEPVFEQTALKVKESLKCMSELIFVFVQIWISAPDGINCHTTRKVGQMLFPVVGKSNILKKMDGNPDFVIPGHLRYLPRTKEAVRGFITSPIFVIFIIDVRRSIILHSLF